MNPIRKKLVEAMRRSQDFDVLPKYLVTANKLPSEAIELITNTESLIGKMDYLLDAYDFQMKLRSNQNIEILDVMIVW